MLIPVLNIECSRINLNIMYIQYQLRTDRFLCVVIIGEDYFVHLREYEEKNGKRYSTRKGLSLDKNRFKALVLKLDDIDKGRKVVEENVDSMELVHIVDDLYAIIKSDLPTIELRYFHYEKGYVVLSSKGFSIRLEEWELVKQYANALKEMIPDLKSTIP
jgi:hypothetical protein